MAENPDFLAAGRLNSWFFPSISTTALTEFFQYGRVISPIPSCCVLDVPISFSPSSNLHVAKFRGFPSLSVMRYAMFCGVSL